ncbi:hypothetical protein TRVA0_025S01860 [Trichomonascus vanleenenianus]|uniref:Cmr2p n=1 Tax=Trichomonascus vanleenenianus TaxID=2268995 RepID=UPI003EC9B5B3
MNVDLSIPEGLPEGVAAKLAELRQELEDGDITAKGYNKRRDAILSEAAATEELAPLSTVSTTASSSYGGGAAPQPSLSNRPSLDGQSLRYQPSMASMNDFYQRNAYPQESDSWSLYEGQNAPESTGTLPANQQPMYRMMTVDAQRAVAEAAASISNVKLQKPLEPRELPDSAGSDPHNKSIQMSRFDNLPSILRHRGKSISRQNAFVVLDNKGKEVSAIAWDKLASRAEKVAQMIHDKSGLYRGDRVTLLYQSTEVIDFAVALLGCFLAGVVAVPVSPNAPFKDIAYILGSTQSHLALTTDTNMKSMQRVMNAQKLQWPKGVEWWKTNEFGSYHPPNKKAELPALQVPDLAYIEFARSPLGELRGVVMSHRTILHQMTCLTAILQSRAVYNGKDARSSGAGGKTVLCNLDVRQSIGLIIGILLTVYSGNCMVYLPQHAMEVGGLYAHVVSRHRANIILSDYPSLKNAVYNYQAFPHLTRNYSKKHPVDLSHVEWCLIDTLTVDTEFHELLADRWLKPLGNKHAREIVAPLLTLNEHGGMVVSMRDWLKGAEKLGCTLHQSAMEDENGGPFDLSEVLLEKDALTTNTIKIVSTTPSHSITEDMKKFIRVGAFGFPLPDATLAVVNPDTCILSPELDVGEIWIDSPSLSGGFWGLVKETDTVFHATCYDHDGMVDMEFLRTGLLGFTYNGKVYVLGLYEDRLRQKVDEEQQQQQRPESEISETNSIVGNARNNAISQYRYHYTAHLVQTIMRAMHKVHDCSAFDIFVNGEHLPVVIAEVKFPAVGGPSMQQLNEITEGIIAVLNEVHKVRLYCVLITPAESLPRIMRSGRPEIGNMLCKRRFDMGALPAVYVKFGLVDNESSALLRSIPMGPDPDGGIWSPAISHIRNESLGDEQQYSGVDFRDVVIDDRTAAPLSDFDSIVQILQWRISHQSDELAYSTIDARGRESKGLSWKKFDQKIAAVAAHLKIKLRMRAGDTVVVMMTHSEEYVISVYACLTLGVTVIPLSPIDSNRLNEDVPTFLSMCKEYSVRTILVNGDTETTLKAKGVHQHMKQTASVLKMTIPLTVNTAKCKLTNHSWKDFRVEPAWLKPDYAALVWVYWTADHKWTAVQLSHQTIMGMCKIQKETCQMSSTKPVVGCVRSVSGIGFLHTVLMGPYLGASTLILSPIDFASNPTTFFLSLSRYKVKDTYATPQMIDHACAMMKPKGFSLAETKNLMVSCDGRPRTDLVKKMRLLFSATGLESSSINLGYSHSLNPLITTRSYMSLEPIDLWLDPIALRQGYISVVNPDNCANALHLHDSGMVPVSTQVAIVNPETCQLCKIGEYGEIWVYSDGNVAGFYRSKDTFSQERLHGKLADTNADVEYVRTGDLGFLHTVTKQLPNNSGSVEMQTLFVLGTIGETFEVLGLNHFPIDIENSIERAHRGILGAAIFQAGGMTIVLCEVAQSQQQYGMIPVTSPRHLSLASLVPVVVNTVLNDHQFVVDIVAFVGRGDLPRSRLQEKQRGKIMASWVQKKLNLLGQFGVNLGEKSMAKAIRPEN